MPDDATLAATFAQLSELFAPYRAPLIAKADEPGNLYLETPPSAKYPADLYFGAVKIGKRYVSFHLMPVYTNPELLENTSPALRKRMQGKSCFNFTRRTPPSSQSLHPSPPPASPSSAPSASSHPANATSPPIASSPTIAPPQ